MAVTQLAQLGLDHKVGGRAAFEWGGAKIFQQQIYTNCSCELIALVLLHANNSQ